jgi:hypothetical protein
VARHKVRQRAVLQVGDDLFDDRVAAVFTFGLEHRQRRIGEHRMVAPDPEQLALRVHLNVLRVLITDPAHDQAGGDPFGLRLGRECCELDFGDLGIRDPLLQLLVEDRPRVVDRCPRILTDRGRPQ